MGVFYGPNSNIKRVANGAPGLLASSGLPTLVLDFSSNASLLNGVTNTATSFVTYTRASTATYVNSAGLVTISPNNTPRFDYDPNTGYCKGLLIEEQRTNLYLNSTSIAMGGSAQSYVTAPDGTLTAIKSVPDGSTAYYHSNISALMTVSTNTVYTMSFYAKSFGYTGFQYQLRDGGGSNNYVRGSLNLGVGTATLLSSGGDYSAPSTSIAPVGNGWYRVILTGTTGAGTSVALNFYQGHTDGNDIVLPGDGVSGSAIWGAQLEAGAFPTSYIPTGAAQVTRVADLAIVTGTNFSSWFNANQGSFYVEAQLPLSGYTISGIFAVANTSSPGTNSIDTFSRGPTLISNQSCVNGTYGGSDPIGTITSGTFFKNAYTYQSTGMTASVNGNYQTFLTTSSVPSGINQLNIGNQRTNGFPANGCIRRLIYYPTLLTSLELQTLTT